MSAELTAFDWRVRAAVYRHFIAEGRPPTPEDLVDDVARDEVDGGDDERDRDRDGGRGHAMHGSDAGHVSTTAPGAVEVIASLSRLAAAHQLVLWPRTTEIWMAHPFSGVETDYAVSAGGRRWFANCAWDALGVPAMLGLDESETLAECSDCGRHVRFGLRAGRPFSRPADAVVHFAVPPRRFWDDIGFT